MSFISDIISFGLGKIGIKDKSGTISALASTAVTGLLLNKVNKSIKLNNPDDQSREIRVVPEISTVSTENTIPVVYGKSWLSGIVTDVQPSDDGCSLYYVVTLCEKTGPILSAANAASTIWIEQVQWRDYQITFQNDGFTSENLYYPFVDGPLDTSSINTELNGKLEIYAYNNGSTGGTSFRKGYQSGTAPDARDLVPNWTVNHTMSDLAFVVIKVNYSTGANLTGISEFRFEVTNTMTQPGDVLYDYMTNTRYGAGIPAAEIDV
jgi:hypothetical protein